MPATHVSGQDYRYLFDHTEDKPTFHTDRSCAGDYTSDMVESAAVERSLDGDMVPCEDCCDEFPVEFHDCDVTELDRSGWYSIRFTTLKATLKPDVDVDDLHPDVYGELAQRGFRLE